MRRDLRWVLFPHALLADLGCLLLDGIAWLDTKLADALNGPEDET